MAAFPCFCQSSHALRATINGVVPTPNLRAGATHAPRPREILRVAHD
jgi:hypothetical protein